MFNGEVLSYGISKTPSAASVLSAQKQAIEITSELPIQKNNSIQTEVGHIKWVHIPLFLKKTKYFKVCLGKEIVMITL